MEAPKTQQARNATSKRHVPHPVPLTSGCPLSREIVTGPRAVASASPPQGGGDRSVRGEWTAALSVRLAADGRAGIFSDASRWEGLLSPWNLPSPPLAFLALGHAPRRLADDSLDSGTPVNTRGIKAGIHCFFHSFVKRRPSGFAVRDRLREAASASLRWMM